MNVFFIKESYLELCTLSLITSKMWANSSTNLLPLSYVLELGNKKLLILLGLQISMKKALLLIKHLFIANPCGMSSWKNKKLLEFHGIVHTGSRKGYDYLTILSEKTFFNWMIMITFVMTVRIAHQPIVVWSHLIQGNASSNNQHKTKHFCHLPSCVDLLHWKHPIT